MTEEKYNTLKIFLHNRHEWTPMPSEACIPIEDLPLEKIQDNHPKYVVTLDEDQQALRKGIIHQNIRDFLPGN
jgi:hypothetical protein